MPGWGGGFAGALQHGDALPRSCSGEATCLLCNLASDLAFLWVSYCLWALSHVVELCSEGFTLAVLCPSLCMYIWYYFWATCSAVLSSAFVPQAWSLAESQHGPCLVTAGEGDWACHRGPCLILCLVPPDTISRVLVRSPWAPFS